MQIGVFSATGITYRSLLHTTSRFDINEVTPDEATALMNEQEHFWINEIDCGWPMRSFERDRWGYRDGLKVPERDSNGWLLDTDPRLELPVKFVLTGTVVNTVFYGLATFVAAFALYQIRASRRRRRGHCPRCNFDLRHDLAAGCPECGWRRMNNSSERAESSTTARRD